MSFGTETARYRLRLAKQAMVEDELARIQERRARRSARKGDPASIRSLVPPNVPLPPLPSTPPPGPPRTSIVIPASILRSTPSPRHRDPMQADLSATESETLALWTPDASPVGNELDPPKPRRSSKVRFSQEHMPSANSHPLGSPFRPECCPSPIDEFKRDLETARRQLREASIASFAAATASPLQSGPSSQRLSELSPPKSTPEDFSPRALPYPKMSRTLARLSGSFDPKAGAGSPSSEQPPARPSPTSRKSSYSIPTPTTPMTPSPLSASFSSSASDTSFARTSTSSSLGTAASALFLSDHSQSTASSSAGSSMSLGSSIVPSRYTLGPAAEPRPVDKDADRVPQVNRQDWTGGDVGLSPRSVPLGRPSISEAVEHPLSGPSSTRSSFALPAPHAARPLPAITLSSPWDAAKALDGASSREDLFANKTITLDVRIHPSVSEQAASGRNVGATELPLVAASPPRRPSLSPGLKLVKRKSVNYGAMGTCLLRRESSVYSVPKKGSSTMEVFLPSAILEPTVIEEPESSARSTPRREPERWGATPTSSDIVTPTVVVPPSDTAHTEAASQTVKLLEPTSPAAATEGNRPLPPPIPPRSPQRLLQKPPLPSPARTYDGWSGSDSDEDDEARQARSVQERRHRAKLLRQRSAASSLAPLSPPTTPEDCKRSSLLSGSSHASSNPRLFAMPQASEASLSSASTEVVTPPPGQGHFDKLARSHFYSPLAARSSTATALHSTPSPSHETRSGSTKTALPPPGLDISDWGPPEILLDEDFGQWKSRSLNGYKSRSGRSPLDSQNTHRPAEARLGSSAAPALGLWDNLPDAPMLWSESPDPTWHEMSDPIAEMDEDDGIGLAI